MYSCTDQYVNLTGLAPAAIIQSVSLAGAPKSTIEHSLEMICMQKSALRKHRRAIRDEFEV